MQDNLRTAASASNSAQIAVVNADFDLFLASLKLDQVTFRATLGADWAVANAFACSHFPVFCGTADNLASYDTKHASWVTTATTGKLGVANILWVNFSALGVASPEKLYWVARLVAHELHSEPATSVAILIHSNQCSSDIAVKHRVGSTRRVKYGDSLESDVEYAEEPSLRSSLESIPLRHWRVKVQEAFSEASFGLTVKNAQIIFRPDTVWDSRPGHHGMLVVLPRSVLLSAPASHPTAPTTTRREANSQQ